MILNNEKRYRKLLEIAKDPYSNHEGMVMTTNKIHFINNCEITKMWPEG